MVRRPSLPTSGAQLRRQAERRVRQRGDRREELPDAELRLLVHELRVHQAELEIQHEEVRHAYRELERAHDRFADLYDFAPVGYLTVHLEGRIIEVNLTMARMLGVSRSVLKGGRLYRYVAEPDLPVFFAHRRGLLEAGGRRVDAVRMQRADGSSFDAELESVLVRDEQGHPESFRTTVHDVAARRDAERGWRLADAVIDASNEGVVVVDRRRHIYRVNRALTGMTGFTADELLGRDLAMLAGEGPEHRAIDRFWDHLQRAGRWTGELWCRRRDAGAFPGWVSFTGIHDERGQTTHYAGLVVDATERRRREEQMRQQAYYDGTTGLPNRTLFLERLTQAIRDAHRHGTATALLFFDLDRFKQVNDSLGHAAGDQFLRIVAERLTGCVRDNDSMARIGGDEFAAVLPDMARGHDAAKVARKVLEVLRHPVELGGRSLPCGCSLGIAVYPDDAEDVDELRRCADTAMYGAKEAGGNTFRFFDASAAAGTAEHARIERELRRALDTGELVLHYQPIFHADSGRPAGSEALLRWQHPQRGLLSPDPFLALAEDLSQLAAIGSWTIETACREATRWSTRHGEPFVAVNVFAGQLSTPTGRDRLLRSLADCGLPAGRLALEVPESLTRGQTPGLVENLQEIRRLGSRVAVEDFGLGQSSLACLRELPLELLKLDRRIIQELDTRDDAGCMVRGIIAMAHALGIEVMAEGVESETQIRILRETGCDHLQGDVLSEPMTGEAFRALLESGQPPEAVTGHPA